MMTSNKCTEYKSSNPQWMPIESAGNIIKLILNRLLYFPALK